MKKILLTISFIILAFSGCSTSTASKKVDAVNYPDCVPGPYGECPNIVTKK